MNKNGEKISTLLLWTIIAFGFFTTISLLYTKTFVDEMDKHQKEFSQKYEKVLDIIQKNQANPNATNTIVFEKKDENTYQAFLATYYKDQSDWLNIWLTILAITMGIMGIAIPILMADKKKEMDNAIEKGEKVLENIQKQASVQIEKLEIFAKDLEKVAFYAKKAEESEKKAEASVLFAEANQHHHKEEFDQAIEKYKKALELNPAYYQAYLNIGNAYMRQKKYNDALNACNKAIKINPKYSEAFLNRGLTYLRLNNYDAALKDYNKAIEINPNYHLAYLYRGQYYYKHSDYHTALKDYDKAIELNPDNYHAYLDKSAVYIELKQYNDALNACNKAIELNPEFADAYCNRANIHIQLKNYQLAIKDCQKSIQLDGNDPIAYYNLTEAYIFNIQFEEALNTIKLYIQKINDPYIYNDDNNKWMNFLNAHSECTQVVEIKEIIENKFIKKDRE